MCQHCIYLLFVFLYVSNQRTLTSGVSAKLKNWAEARNYLYYSVGLLRPPGGFLSSFHLDSPFSSQWQIIRIHQIHLVAACIAEGDFSTPTNYEFLKHLGNRVYLWHAEDDRVVPFTIGQELSLVLPDAIFHPFAPDRWYGHFYGIPAFPELENELLER